MLMWQQAVTDRTQNDVRRVLELLEKGVDENTFIKEMDAWWETHCYDN